MTKYTKEFLRLLNMDIYCEYKIDEKPTLILIHGFVSSTSTFQTLIPLLSNYYSIIAFDLPGFGKSEKCTTFKYSYDNYGKLLVALMNYFQLDDVTLVGHSMGGQIALYTARRIPTRIQKLILLASSSYLKKAHAVKRYSSFLPFSNYVAKFVVNQKTVVDYMQNVLYDHRYITRELIEAYEAPLQEKAFYKSLIRLLRYREGDLASEELRKIEKPTLLVWGKEDQVVPLAIGERLQKDLPKSKLITYEQTGHLLTIEKPEALTEHILSFMN